MGILYAVSAMLIKCTLLVFYLRLFHPNRTSKFLIWTGIVAIVLFYTISIVATLAKCLPASQDYSTPGTDPGKWDERTSNSHCGHFNLDIGAAEDIFSAVTDLYVLAIPVSSVMALQLPRSGSWALWLYSSLDRCEYIYTTLLAIATL